MPGGNTRASLRGRRFRQEFIERLFNFQRVGWLLQHEVRQERSSGSNPVCIITGVEGDLSLIIRANSTPVIPGMELSVKTASGILGSNARSFLRATRGIYDLPEITQKPLGDDAKPLRIVDQEDPSSMGWRWGLHRSITA